VGGCVRAVDEEEGAACELEDAAGYAADGGVTMGCAATAFGENDEVGVLGVSDFSDGARGTGAGDHGTGVEVLFAQSGGNFLDVLLEFVFFGV